MTNAAVGYPLSGVRVVDMTQTLAGPYATMLLGDLGAEVIKIESPTRPDMARTVPGGRIGSESTYYLSLNRNKKSVALDLTSAEGRARLLHLVAKSDVVIDNFRPGVMERLGLSSETLARTNPGIVQCSITGFGRTGPLSDRPGYDYMMQALAGTMALTGGPDDPPTKYGISVVDHAAGVFAAFAVVAALHGRQHRPAHKVISIDLSLLDTHLSMLTYLACDYLNFGDVPQRLAESAHHSLVPAQVFPTLDGYLVVMVLANRFWPALCKAIDRPDLSSDVRFADPDTRRTNREVLIEDLKETFRTRSTAAWVSTLTVHDVPNAPVQTMAEAFAMDQVAAREMVVDLEHHGYGKYRSVGNPIKFEGLELPMEPAPTLGEHTEDVVATDETGNLGGIDQDSTDVPVFDVDLAVRSDGGILVITLDRPEKANALTRPMIDGLARAIRWAEAEDSIRVVIITGAGDRVFCAGFDVSTLTSPGRADSGVERDLVDDLAGIVASSSIPVVAAVNGAAVGAGCDLAVACDSRIASVNAYFAMPPSRIGIMYGWRGMARLLSAVGRSMATDLLLTGDSLNAERAQTLGLVSQVVPQETLLQAAFAKARRLADNAPLSIRATKASIGLLADGPLDQDRQRELDRFQQMVWDSRDAVEGTRAARDRRQPRFEGR